MSFLNPLAAEGESQLKKDVSLVKEPAAITRLTGCPVVHVKDSLTAGPHGPVLLQDVELLERVKQFVREKIPARNVHALGTGAYGQLTITNDISQYTYADALQVGKVTPFFARFSGTFIEQGEADTTRDIRGLALKFYTEVGNWDLMCINMPVFNVRDGKPGPDTVHAFKRDPRNGEWNPTQTWDYTATHPEGLHNALMFYTDKMGTPASFRHMNVFACNTYSLINAQKKRVWVKFHLVSLLGELGLTGLQARLLAGEEPNWLSADLRRAIEQGNFPKWKLCIQVMPEEAGYSDARAFDCTKIWPVNEFPLMDVGVLEVNRNPIDYFSEVEQVAFSPASVIPGIGFSPDRLLQGRLLIYDDAQHHRIGSNFKQLPINRPLAKAHTNAVGGEMNVEIRNRFPHYMQSSFGALYDSPELAEPPMVCDGPAGYYNLPLEGTDADCYLQPREFLKTLTDEERQHLVDNIAVSFTKVAPTVVEKLLFHFNKIHEQFGERVRLALDQLIKGQAKLMPGAVVATELRGLLETQATMMHRA